MDERPVTRRQFTALTAAVCALGLVAVAGPIVVYEATRSTGGSGTAAVPGVLTPAWVAPPSGQSRQLPGGAGASEPTGPVGGPAADPVHRPAYAITASVDPRSGLVDGAERVRCPPVWVAARCASSPAGATTAATFASVRRASTAARCTPTWTIRC